MFDSANFDHSVSKEAFKREASQLRVALLNVQYDVKENGKFPVVILIAGVEGSDYAARAIPGACPHQRVAP